MGFEAEFFIFEDVQYSVQGHRVGFSVDCKEEAHWNSDGEHMPIVITAARVAA